MISPRLRLPALASALALTAVFTRPSARASLVGNDVAAQCPPFTPPLAEAQPVAFAFRLATHVDAGKAPFASEPVSFQREGQLVITASPNGTRTFHLAPPEASATLRHGILRSLKEAITWDAPRCTGASRADALTTMAKDPVSSHDGALETIRRGTYVATTANGVVVRVESDVESTVTENGRLLAHGRETITLVRLAEIPRPLPLRDSTGALDGDDHSQRTRARTLALLRRAAEVPWPALRAAIDDVPSASGGARAQLIDRLVAQVATDDAVVRAVVDAATTAPAGSDRLTVLIGGLSLAGTTSSQAALVTLLDRRDREPLAARQLLAATTQVRRPDAALVDAVAARLDHPATAGTAALALGAFARRLRREAPERAAALDRLLTTTRLDERVRQAALQNAVSIE